MITYNFNSNPNLPRLLDEIKLEYNIDLPLDSVINNVGHCLRLIGMKDYDGTDCSIKTDHNGFPIVETEEQYYACLQFIIYKYFLNRFVTGIEDGNKLQYWEMLKDRAILQARRSIFNKEKMEDIIKIQYNSYRDGNINKRR